MKHIVMDFESEEEFIRGLRPVECPGCLYSGQPHLSSCLQEQLEPLPEPKPQPKTWDEPEEPLPLLEHRRE